MPFDTPRPSASISAFKGDAVSGIPLSVGRGFNALSFKHTMYSGTMDPLIMVDHFVMTESTFGPHAHAGISAVSILFEDSQGNFHNMDSLGNDIDLMPGDLYWLKAGRGAVHDEKPRPGARTHALQVFVNLPGRMKYDAPDSLHVRSSDMPVLSGEGYRARLMLGESENLKGETSPALPMTIIDLMLENGGQFAHKIPAGQAAFILSIDGDAKAEFGEKSASLSRGSSISLEPLEQGGRLFVSSSTKAHVVILQAAPIKEDFVQQGPFAMSTQAEVDAMFAAHAAGELGSIDF